jgi:uncharacterized membrane protein YkoI
MKTWLRLTLMAGAVLAMSGSVALADWDIKQLKQVRAAPTSLRAAIATAERDLKGRAYYASCTVGADSVTYTVKVDAGDKAMTAEIDGKTGKINSSGPAPGESPVLLKEFAKLKSGLLAAMKAAESTAKGKSFEALFKRIGNKDVFEVDVAGRDDVEKDVLVDAITGKIRKVAERTPEPAAATSPGTTPAAQ